MNTQLARLIQSLSPEKGKELFDAYGAAALDTIVVALLEALPENKVDEFYRIAKVNDPDAFGEFLHDAVPHLDKILEEEMDRFQREAEGLIAP